MKIFGGNTDRPLVCPVSIPCSVERGIFFWGETSADHTTALTEYLLEHYNIGQVYLHGMSGGEEMDVFTFPSGSCRSKRDLQFFHQPLHGAA